jgi:hypothetical protein
LSLEFLKSFIPREIAEEDKIESYDSYSQMFVTFSAEPFTFGELRFVEFFVDSITPSFPELIG